MKKDALAIGLTGHYGLTDSPPKITLYGYYDLTDEAFEREREINPQAKQRQIIAAWLDEREAIRTKYVPNCDNFILCKLKPDLNRVGVVREPPIPVFEHILSIGEATEIVEREMARYDEVLGVSQAAHNERSNTVMVTLTGTYSLTEEAHRELFLAGTPVTRDQTINVTVNAREALRTGYLHLHRDGKALQTGGISPRALFSKMVKMDSEGITREIPEFDHVLTEEEATKIITDEMDRYDAMSAESIKIAEKKVEKHREEIDDLIKTLDHYLPKIKKGEACVIDPSLDIPQWFEMEGKRINIQYDLIKEKSGEDQAIKTGKFFVDERTKRSDEPVLAWIKEHGSPRLQRAVFEANLLDQLRELYHDERLAHDLPGWKFLHYATLTRDLMRAPFDHELDTFIEVAQTWPTKNARLCMIRKQHENAFTDEPILVMECPWDEEHAPVGLLLPLSAPESTPVENPAKDPNIDSHKEFYENLPSGTILMDCASAPVRIMEMKKTQGLHTYRYDNNPEAKRFAKKWLETPNLYDNTLAYLLHVGSDANHDLLAVSERDHIVAATIIQWLGSPMGRTFLRELGYKRSHKKKDSLNMRNKR